MKTTGLIAIVFGYHKKSQQTLGLSTGNFVKKNWNIGRSVSEWRKILYRIGNRIGHFFGIGAPLSYRHTYVAICTHINCYASYTVLALKRCITTSQSLGITGLLLYLEYCDDIYNLVRLRQISCLSLS